MKPSRVHSLNDLDAVVVPPLTRAGISGSGADHSKQVALSSPPLPPLSSSTVLLDSTHGNPLPTFEAVNDTAESSPAARGAAGPEDDEPLITNGSVALAEFTSLLQHSDRSILLKEHIFHLLQDVETEDTLVQIARTLEDHNGGTDEKSGARNRREVCEVSSTTDWTDSAQQTPTATMTTVSQSTANSLENTIHRYSSTWSRSDGAGFDALAGLSFLHSGRRLTTTAVADTPSSAHPSEDMNVNQSLCTPSGELGTSFNSRGSRTTKEESITIPATGVPLRSRRDGFHRSSHRRSSIFGPLPSRSRETAHVDPLNQEMSVLPAAVRNEGRRVAVSAAPFSFDELRQTQSRIIAKTPAEEQQIRRLLHRCHIFSALEPSDIADVVHAMQKEVYAAGTAILEQGNDSTEMLYLVGEGTCEGIKNGKSLGPLQPGSTFGELELMYKQAKCAATVRCVTRCVLYTLDETSYHRAVMSNSLQKRKKFESLTLNVPFLRCMPDYERMRVAEALQTRTYHRGHTIIKFGDKGQLMHFIVEGEVKVVGRSNGRQVEVVRLHAGDVVGELEFLFNHLTVADVIATSKRVVTACISREHFQLIVGPIQNRLKEFVATSPTYETYYIADAANESVRSELSRIETSKKHRRVTPKEARVATDDMDPHGEVLLCAPLSLLTGSEATNNVAQAAVLKELRQHRRGAIQEAADESVASAASPKALLRFPFAPVTGKAMAVMALREDGLIIYWNSVLENLTSYPSAEVVGQNIYSFLLEEHEQQTMYNAINAARTYAGEVSSFFEHAHRKSSNFTLARSDGLTKATLRLTLVPPASASGEDTAEVLLAFGEEVKEGPQQMLEQPQWLSAQIRSILAEGTQTYETRLQFIAEVLNNFEATYRAMTVSTERLRVVNIRQMVGQVMMDFGSDCVKRGLSVRQRFEGLTSERAYLDANLLPECLRYAMNICVKYNTRGGILTIMITLTEKNGLEFLVINFNILGNRLPLGFARAFEPKLPQHDATADPTTGSFEVDDEDVEGDIGSTDEETSSLSSSSEDANHSGTGSRRVAPKAMKPRQRRRLRRVQNAVEEQGGTMRVQCNADNSNIVFLIPFMPASAHDMENASVEESMRTQLEASQTSFATPPVSQLAPVPSTSIIHSDPNDGRISLTLPASAVESTPLIHLTPTTTATPVAQPAYNFTTLVAEDTPAHRNMLCSFLWERRHAVLPAYTFDDIERLAGVADILLIDLQQSIITSHNTVDPIALLREMSRQMAIIITSKSFDVVSAETYDAAGFITLKKPCTPVQAMQAIRKAEDKIALVKQEAERIAMTRETLSRNSRGAWRRGKLLGKGTHGEVYEAFDVLTGGKMAVKEMRLGKHNIKIEQFVDEISAMCNLHHPNIIHYFYCEESTGENVIRVFMEYAAGGTLQTLLSKKGKLEHGEYRALLRDIVEGLAYIHSQHYVHGDIKTANVLLSQDGKGKIGDFGTACTVQDGKLLYEMQGSPLYMSPECMSAGEMDEDNQKVGYSFPSDIWSLGCVAMEMATNKPPFSHVKGVSGPAGLTRYITSLTDVPDLSPLFRCPPPVVEFVSACLNPDPSQRATAQDLLQLSIFDDSTSNHTQSAVTSLKRAQLLHVLNKFVAFQEPAETEKKEKQDTQFKTRRRSLDFFDSSSSSDDSPVRSSKEMAVELTSGTAVPRLRSNSTAVDDGLPQNMRRWSSSSSTTASSVTSSTPSSHHKKARLRKKGKNAASSSASEPRASSIASEDDEPPARAPHEEVAAVVVSPQEGQGTVLSDLSPTPKKRSKTRSHPPPLPVSISPDGTRTTSNEPDANAAVVVAPAASAPLIHTDSDSEALTRMSRVKTPSVAFADTANAAGAPHTFSNTSSSPLPIMSPTRADSLYTPVFSDPPNFTGRRRGIMGDDQGNLYSRQQSSTSPSQSDSKPRKMSNVEWRTLGYLGGGGGDAQKRNSSIGAGGAAMGSMVFQGAGQSFAHMPAGKSFYNYSFNKNISFLGANMDELLSSAANDFLNNLVSNANASSGHTSRATSTGRHSSSVEDTRYTEAAANDGNPFTPCSEAPQKVEEEEGEGREGYNPTQEPRSPSAVPPTANNSNMSNSEPLSDVVVPGTGHSPSRGDSAGATKKGEFSSVFPFLSRSGSNQHGLAFPTLQNHTASMAPSSKHNNLRSFLPNRSFFIVEDCSSLAPMRSTSLTSRNSYLSAHMPSYASLHPSENPGSLYMAERSTTAVVAPPPPPTPPPLFASPPRPPLSMGFSSYYSTAVSAANIPEPLQTDQMESQSPDNVASNNSSAYQSMTSDLTGNSSPVSFSNANHGVHRGVRRVDDPMSIPSFLSLSPRRNGRLYSSVAASSELFGYLHRLDRSLHTVVKLLKQSSPGSPTQGVTTGQSCGSADDGRGGPLKPSSPLSKEQPQPSSYTDAASLPSVLPQTPSLQAVRVHSCNALNAELPRPVSRAVSPMNSSNDQASPLASHNHSDPLNPAELARSPQLSSASSSSKNPSPEKIDGLLSSLLHRMHILQDLVKQKET